MSTFEKLKRYIGIFPKTIPQKGSRWISTSADFEEDNEIVEVIRSNAGFVEYGKPDHPPIRIGLTVRREYFLDTYVELPK